ncbi:YicC/YloC family endoribonuclease [Bacteroidota bacterium]
MIKSMTGFGRGEVDNDRLKAVVEIKSLNSKFLDINIKLPKVFSEKEIEVRNLLSKVLNRGKVNVLIDYHYKVIDRKTQIINEELFKTYYSKLKTMADDMDDKTADLFRMSLLMPDVLDIDSGDDPDQVNWNDVLLTIEDSARKCDEFRLAEGKTLEKEFKVYIQSIEANLEEIENIDPNRIDEIKTKIRGNLNELLPEVEVDENRFEQELIYYIEKLDISEEEVRLRSHLDHFKKTLDSDQSNGKKLNFISQEIGREINTIGAKANYAPIQKYVIAMKDELEKIKEQLLNIL